jgi:hypothetical protein
MKPAPDVVRYQAHEAVNLNRDMSDILTRGEKWRED